MSHFVETHPSASEIPVGRPSRSKILVPPRIVALGGGTGLPRLLQGLRDELHDALDEDRARAQSLTAIVIVSKDGAGFAARRGPDEAPWREVRDCLVALADADASPAELFEQNLGEDGGAEHVLGNLVLEALSRIDVPFTQAIKRAGELLSIYGRVLPANAEAVSLEVYYRGGRSAPSRVGPYHAIERVRLSTPDVPATAEAERAIEAADLVVVGPGSLFKSLIPLLLVPGLARALQRTKARVVFVMNLMTEPGETDGFAAADHVRAIQGHAPHVAIHDVLLNRTPLDWGRLLARSPQGARPVPTDESAIRRLGIRSTSRDLVGSGLFVRHDPRKLARAILELGWPTLPEAEGR